MSPAAPAPAPPPRPEPSLPPPPPEQPSSAAPQPTAGSLPSTSPAASPTEAADGPFRRLRHRAAAAWRRALDAPGGPGRVARGIAAGAFAAMLPVFGLHVLFALAAAWLARGSGVAAAAACLMIGNPLTHVATVPAAYELGRRLLHLGPSPGAGRLPPWLSTLLPAAGETLAGGVLMGVAAAAVAYALARRALRGRRPAVG